MEDNLHYLAKWKTTLVSVGLVDIAQQLKLAVAELLEVSGSGGKFWGPFCDGIVWGLSGSKN